MLPGQTVRTQAPSEGHRDRFDGTAQTRQALKSRRSHCGLWLRPVIRICRLRRQSIPPQISRTSLHLLQLSNFYLHPHDMQD